MGLFAKLFMPNLKKMQAKRDVRGLIKVLRSKAFERSALRENAASALGELGDESALEVLTWALEDKNSYVRVNAVKALGKIGGKRAVESLIQALRHEDLYFRHGAIDGLGDIGDERAVQPLIQVLQDKDMDSYSREKASWALGKIGDERAVDPLIQALRYEKDSGVRMRAAESLGKMRARRAVEPLSYALKDKSWQVRCYAAQSLGELRDKRAIEPLIQALKDEGGLAKEATADALGTITLGAGRSRDLYWALEQIMQSEATIEKQQDASWLKGEKSNKPIQEPISQEKQIGISTELQRLMRLLRDEKETVRIGAAESLLAMGGKGVPLLIDALKDKNEEVSSAAAWAIKLRLMNREGAEEEELRRALSPAVQYLTKIVEGATIRTGAESYDEYVARAINTLRAIGDPAAIPALLSLLARVEAKIKAQGVVREYVDTGRIRGYVSSEDETLHIRLAVDDIRKRQMKK